MKINLCIKGLDFDPDWSILDIDSRISKVSFWYWVITWFPGYEMWPKSACDFLAPLLLSRNRRFAECILIPRKPNPCSIEFGNPPSKIGKNSLLSIYIDWSSQPLFRALWSFNLTHQAKGTKLPLLHLLPMCGTSFGFIASHENAEDHQMSE